MPEGRDRERRWIVLCTDGRHVTLGRHTDPTEDEVVAAENSLSSAGLAGWLAVMAGDYYSRKDQPNIMPVRPLACPVSAFEDAKIAFETSRSRMLGDGLT